MLCSSLFALFLCEHRESKERKIEYKTEIYLKTVIIIFLGGHCLRNSRFSKSPKTFHISRSRKNWKRNENNFKSIFLSVCREKLEPKPNKLRNFFGIEEKYRSNHLSMPGRTVTCIYIEIMKKSFIAIENISRFHAGTLRDISILHEPRDMSQPDQTFYYNKLYDD